MVVRISDTHIAFGAMIYRPIFEYLATIAETKLYFSYSFVLMSYISLRNGRFWDEIPQSVECKMTNWKSIKMDSTELIINLSDKSAIRLNIEKPIDCKKI